eukprot:6845396-Pyramimonas_sp.AAC.1
MAAVERRSAIWSPLNRRLVLRAVKHPNGATRASSDSAVMTQRLVDHLGSDLQGEGYRPANGTVLH